MLDLGMVVRRHRHASTCVFECATVSQGCGVCIFVLMSVYDKETMQNCAVSRLGTKDCYRQPDINNVEPSVVVGSRRIVVILTKVKESVVWEYPIP